MVEENFGSAIVDVCSSGCHGIWFDKGELEKLDSRTKGAGPALTRALAHAPQMTSVRALSHCPRCRVRMKRRSHELIALVNLDECLQCSGIFLNSGELARLRTRTWQDAARARRKELEGSRDERQLETTSAPLLGGNLDFIEELFWLLSSLDIS